MNTEKINTRKDFIKFIRDLRNDLMKNKSEWENQNLESFLEAMESYAEDIGGYYKNNKININPDMPQWRTFADIMVGASIYE
jgi:hypothetical protein